MKRKGGQYRIVSRAGRTSLASYGVSTALIADRFLYTALRPCEIASEYNLPAKAVEHALRYELARRRNKRLAAEMVTEVEG